MLDDLFLLRELLQFLGAPGPARLGRSPGRGVVAAPAVGPSALAFAMAAHAQRPPSPAPVAFSAPEAPLPGTATPAPVPAALGALDLPAPAPDPARTLAARLRATGHRLLTRDGKFFVSEASRLTDDDRAAIKEHKPALLAQAEPWLEPRATSLAAFLGQPAPTMDYAWVAEAPRSLDGMRDIVLNFETNGLQWSRGDEPIGVTVGALDGSWSKYYPFAHRPGGNLDREQVLEFLRHEVRGKHIHNINTRFDLHMARNIGVDLEGQGNTVTDIAHTVALLDDHRKRFALDILMADLLPDYPKVPRLDEAHMADYHAAEVAARAEYQVQAVAQLHAALDHHIDEQDLRPVQNLEDAVIFTVVEMEKNGAPIDQPLLETYGRDCVKLHDDLLMKISKEVGFSFDHTPASWQKLFDRYGIPTSHLKTGKASFADGVIAQVDHPIFRDARFAGQLSSLNSKIFKPYREMVGEDGLLRFDLHQLRGEEGGTVSGRFSAPYIHQVPNKGNHYATFGDELFPRRLFIPAPGAQYLSADAAQIQYRIFAHHANNPKILNMYADNPQASFHKMMMGLLQPHKPDIIYEHVKGMNFMKIFGGGLAKLALMMGYITESDMEDIMGGTGNAKRWDDPRLAKAKEIQQIYDREMPEVGPLLQKAIHLALPKCGPKCNTNDVSRRLHREGLPHRGFVKTVLGRRSRFPDDYRSYKAFCMVDQGSEGDIIKTKLVELHRERKHTGFLMRMTVHDEISGDAQMPETRQRVFDILNHQSFPTLRVPILWECGVGANWAEAK